MRTHRRPVPLAVAGLLALLLLQAPPARSAALYARSIVAIGGSYEDAGVMAHLLDMVGKDANIVILPLASGEPEVAGDAYRTYFRALGAEHVSVLDALNRAQADDERKTAMLAQADLLFFTGGNQTILTRLLTGTSLGVAVTSAWARGALIAGTSAGAMVWGADYIADGESAGALSRGFAADRHGGPGLDLRPGIGLFPDLLVDTRFSDQDRLGRLLLGVASDSQAIGLGVDARTAAVVTPGEIRAVGPGTVTVVTVDRGALDTVAGAEVGKPLALGAFGFDRLVDGLVVPRTTDVPTFSASDASRWAATGPSILLSQAARPAIGDELASRLVRAAGGNQASPLILAGNHAYQDGLAWQQAFLRAGAPSAPVVSVDDLSELSLQAALRGATAVWLVEDEDASLLRMLDAADGRLAREIADVAQREPIGAAGAAVRLLGDRALFLLAGHPQQEDWPGLGVLPAVVDEGVPGDPGFDRLLSGQAIAKPDMGIGLLPDSELMLGRGKAIVELGDALLLQQGPTTRFFPAPLGSRATAVLGMLGTLLPRDGRFDMTRRVAVD